MSHVRLWLRTGRRSPGALVFLVLSLAIALAGALAAGALAASVSWRELPFAQPELLTTIELQGRGASPRWWSWPEFQAVRSRPGPAISTVAGYTVADIAAASEAGRPPAALLGTMVTPEFLGLLGVEVAAGRLFTSREQQPGGPRTVLLSHELWQARYGGDPKVVGREIRLSIPRYLEEPGGSFVVVGILAPRTWLFWRRFDVVLPLRAHGRLLADPRAHLIEHVIARARPHASFATVQQSAPVLTTAVKSAGGAEPTDTVSIAPLRSALFRDLQPKVQLVMAIAVAVLLLAGVNVVVAASSAALEQRRDTAVRQAIGATPWRLSRDVGIHVALTAGVATLLASVLYVTLIAALIGIMPDAWLARVPGGGDAVGVGPIGVAALGVLALLFGAASAGWMWSQLDRLTGPSVLQGLHLDTPTRHRWRAVVVGAEVALSTAVVLVATTLSLQFSRLRNVDPGVDGDRTLAFWINPDASTYGEPGPRVAHFERLLDELRLVPGVESVGAIDLPFQFDWQAVAVRAPDRNQASLAALDRSATPSYLDVSGLSLLAGRWLEASDRADTAGAVVVSRSLADALWPGRSAIGQTIQIERDGKPTLVSIVGVVSDIRNAPHAEPARIVYRSVAQGAPSALYLLVRSRLTAADAAGLQAAIWRVDPDQAIDGPWAVSQWIEGRTAFVGFLTRLTALLAFVAVVLAVAGLHAISLYWVRAARRELGIRRAVGASHADVVRWFGRRWGAVVLPALAAGLLIQFLVMRTTASQVEAVEPASLVHLGVGSALMLGYASAAAGAALLRALRTDETTLLR
jgi:putative ABC transport system permease protein